MDADQKLVKRTIQFLDIAPFSNTCLPWLLSVFIRVHLRFQTSVAMLNQFRVRFSCASDSLTSADWSAGLSSRFKIFAAICVERMADCS